MVRVDLIFIENNVYKKTEEKSEKKEENTESTEKNNETESADSGETTVTEVSKEQKPAVETVISDGIDKEGTEPDPVEEE